MKSPRDHRLGEFAARVKALTDPFGSIAKAAEALKIPPNTLSRLRRGENEPTPAVLLALADGLHVSSDYLLGLTDQRTPLTILGPRQAQVDVPLFRAEASAGAGADNGDVSRGEPFPFPTAFIEKCGGRPSSVESLRAHGDSMEPTIANGALLLVDRSQRDLPPFQPKPKKAPRKPIPQDPIYVFIHDRHLRLKRLRLLDENGLVAIISDNIAAHPPEFANLSEMDVLAKVIWWDNRL